MQYVKMPQPLLVIGFFYAVVAVFYLCRFVMQGYWHGMWGAVKTMVLAHPFYNISAIAVLILMVRYFDLPLSRLAKYYYNQDFYTAVDFINSTGEGWFIGAVLFSLILLYQFFTRQQLFILATTSFMASIYAGLFNAVIKIIINRQRPVISMNPNNFFYYIASGCKNAGDLFYASNSMPSGHTITIFAAITPFLCHVRTLKSKAFLLSLGLLICFARVYTLNHWLSDVYVSMILGMVIGRACYICNSQRFKPAVLK